jgi:hypothetical protein
MFSSIARSIKSIAKGPRAVLAENIARVLSEHFVLDPADIESSLLQDAKIVLRNTHLRSRRYRSQNHPNTVVSVNGVVEEVVFSWRWCLTGGSSASSTTGQTSYASGGGVVQDVVLTIRGIKVHIFLDAWDTLDDAEQALVEKFESNSVDDDSEEIASSDGTTLKEKEGFVQRTVQQVVDHLTLKLEDFEFTVQAGSGPSVKITGKDLELETLYSEKKTPMSARVLTQKISIGSFFATVQSSGSEEPFPLIEPFGYAAFVTRSSGDRFQGIMSGLEIDGQPKVHNEWGGTDEGVVLHIGLPQLEALSALGVMLTPSGSYNAEPNSGELKEQDKYVSTVDQTKNSEAIGVNTVFNLPLPALTITLPHSGPDETPTKITLPRATVLYRADGKVFQIEGREGIKDNGASLVELAAGGKWTMNFVEKIFDLGEGCKISLSDETLNRISSSVRALSSIDDVTNLKDALDSIEDSPAGQIKKDSSESWSISTGRVALHLAGSDNKWMEANIAHSSANLPLGIDKFAKANVGECTVRSSFDNATAFAVVPSITFSSGTLRISDTLQASVGSIEDALQIRDFLLFFLQAVGRSNQIEAKATVQPDVGTPALPCALDINQVKLDVAESEMNISLRKLCGKGNSLNCEAAIYTAGESKVESENIHVKCSSTSDVDIQIGTVSSLVIPEVIALKAPVVDTLIKYRGEGMLVAVKTACVTFQRPESQHAGTNTNISKISIPFPIHFDVSYLTAKEDGRTTLFGVKNMSISINQSGSTFTFKSREGMKIRLTESPNILFDITLGNLSLQLQEDDGQFTPRLLKISRAVLGPCSPSCGKLSVVFPPIDQENGQKLSIENRVVISFDSVQVFENLRPLLNSIVGSQEGDPFVEFPFPVDIPGIDILVSEPPSKIQVGKVSASGSTILFEKVCAIVQNTVSFSMRGLKADMVSNSLNVDFVDKFTFPGTLASTKCFRSMNLKMEREVLYINIPTPIRVVMPSRSTSGAPVQNATSAQSNTLSIPFKIKMTVAEVNLNTNILGESRCVQMEKIVFDVSPQIIPAPDLISGEMEKGAQILLEMRHVKSDLFQAQNFHASLMLGLQDLETLHEFRVSLHSPRVTAGFSTLFNGTGSNDKAQHKILKMPFAKIAGTNLYVEYNDSIVDSHATIAVPEFHGDSFTTSDDLSTHYTNTVLKRIPGLLTNVNVLGTNVVDGTFANVGRVALGAGSAATAGVGSVVGTAVSDGVKGAINAGKSTRGAATDDGYKFGDISRGIISGMSSATKKGAQSRGSDGSDYLPGDFTVGAMQSLGNYGSENSGRLASAGASGVAATIGLAVAGPLGFVVGGYLGGRAVGDANGES